MFTCKNRLLMVPLGDSLAFFTLGSLMACVIRIYWTVTSSVTFWELELVLFYFWVVGSEVGVVNSDKGTSQPPQRQSLPQNKLGCSSLLIGKRNVYLEV